MGLRNSIHPATECLFSCQRNPDSHPPGILIHIPTECPFTSTGIPSTAFKHSENGESARTHRPGNREGATPDNLRLASDVTERSRHQISTCCPGGGNANADLGPIKIPCMAQFVRGVTVLLLTRQTRQWQRLSYVNAISSSALHRSLYRPHQIGGS